MKEIWKAHLFLFITSVIQGFNFTISKIVMPDYVSPGAIIVVRGVCAALFFWIVSSVFINEKIKSRQDFIKILLCTIFGVAINQLLFYKGLSLTMPINASLMVTISPVMVLLISAILINEKITVQKIVGILIGATGVISLLLSSSRQGPEDLFIGDVLILINATSYAIFLVLVKPLMQHYHPITILKWMFFLGLFMVTPFGFEGLMEINWSEMPNDVRWSLAFVIVFATLVTYTLNVGVMKTVNPSLAGIYIYLQPAMASIIAVVMGKDTLTFQKVIFSILILAGVFLVSKGNKKRTVITPPME